MAHSYSYFKNDFRLQNLVSAGIIDSKQIKSITYDQKEVLNLWGISSLLTSNKKLLLLENALGIPLDKAKRFDYVDIFNSVIGEKLTVEQVLDLTNASAKNFFGKTLDEMKNEQQVFSTIPSSSMK